MVFIIYVFNLGIKMLTLEDAIIYATKAHKGQKDLSGQPYILHCLAVMMQMDTDTERIIAVLHDVIEDTKTSFRKLYADLNITEEMIDCLSLLSRLPNQDYFEYIKEIKKNPTARKIKIADLMHNMDFHRTLGREEMTEKDKNRIAKYYKARTYLIGE
jgi:(p)ppGpp synthase/HD superfamily hydrolase